MPWINKFATFVVFSCGFVEDDAFVAFSCGFVEDVTDTFFVSGIKINRITPATGLNSNLVVLL